MVSQTNATLLLVDQRDVETTAKLFERQPYYREVCVSHNVINNGKEKPVFIEIEMKDHAN